MASPPVEILLGVYLGLLTGIVPALVAGSLGFVFKYFTGVTLPGFGVVVLAVAIAGINGGLLGLVDPSVSSSPRILTAAVVVMMLSLYAHSQGDKLGTTLPRRFSLRALRRRTLSADVVELVGGIGKVTVRPTGPVADVEGYPPLPAALRAEIAESSYQFPADLPLSELETRMAERLRTDFDLADVTVEVDARGRARVAAAPPTGALSRRVPPGERAVSVEGLVPGGMTRGERVAVEVDGTAVEGTLLAARSGGTPPDPPASPADSEGDGVGTDGGESSPSPQPSGAPVTEGGEGRVTVAVDRTAAKRLLTADRGRVVARSRGTRREFELLGLLRRAGKRIGRVSLRADGPLDGATVGAANVREEYGVAVLALRREGDDGRGWRVSPGGETPLAAGDELFVVGSRADVDRFREAVA